MPVRKIPKSYCHVTGAVASNKSNRLIGYESRPERYFIKHTEFNPNVKSCEEQPVRIPYIMADGRNSHYTPDFLVHFKDALATSVDWCPLLVEIKPRRNLFKDWSVLHRKFLAGRSFARERGWEFTIVSEKELVTPYLDNITFLARYRNYRIDETDSHKVLEAIENIPDATPDTILKSIAQDRESILQFIPVIWHLVADHKIQTDMDSPLTMNSIIEPIASEETDERNYSICTGRMGHARWRALRYYT